MPWWVIYENWFLNIHTKSASLRWLLSQNLFRFYKLCSFFQALVKITLYTYVIMTSKQITKLQKYRNRVLPMWTSQESKVTTYPRCECLTGSSHYTLMWHHSVWEEVVKVCFQRITAEHLSHAHVGLLVCLSVYYAKAVPTQRQHLDLQMPRSLFKGGILLSYSSFWYYTKITSSLFFFLFK